MVDWIKEKALPYFMPIIVFFEAHGLSGAWVGVILWLIIVYLIDFRHIDKNKKLNQHQKVIIIVSIINVLIGIFAQIIYWRDGPLFLNR